MLKLYGYWRSSATYRVRIALNLKGLEYETLPVHIIKDGGEQHQPAYQALNPQELVPTLVDGDATLTQSLAILQYLEERYPQPPLAPREAAARARVWSFCQYIACEIQPLQNTRVLQYLSGTLQVSEEAKSRWLHHWLGIGLGALERSLAADWVGPYCFGDRPGIADCYLVPQMYAAERFGVDLSVCPRLVDITTRLRTLDAFERAHPLKQPDAQPG